MNTTYETDLRFLTNPTRRPANIEAYNTPARVSQATKDAGTGAAKNSDVLQRFAARSNNAVTFWNMMQNATYPHQAASLCDEIWGAVSKVIQAKDSYFRIEKGGSEAALKTEWQAVVDEFFEAYKIQPGGVVVVDFDKSAGQAYLVFVPESSILSITREKGKIIEISYTNENDKKKFTYTQAGVSVSEHKKESIFLPKYWKNIFPVFNISDAFSSDDNTRINVLHSVLGDLEDYLFQSLTAGISKGFAHGQMVQMTYPKQGCGFEISGGLELGGEKCDGGYMYIKGSNGGKILSTTVLGTPKTCPKCNSNPGFGGIMRVHHHEVGNFSNIPEQVRFVAPDVDALEFSSADLDKTRKKIYRKATGRDFSFESNTPLSSRTAAEINAQITEHLAVLNTIRTHIERNLNGVLTCMAEIENFTTNVKVIFSLGEQYQILSESDSITLYLDAEKSQQGLSSVLGYDTAVAESSYPNNKEAQAVTLVKLKLSRMIDDFEKNILKFEQQNQKNILTLLKENEFDIDAAVWEVLVFTEKNEPKEPNDPNDTKEPVEPIAN